MDIHDMPHYIDDILDKLGIQCEIYYLDNYLDTNCPKWVSRIDRIITYSTLQKAERQTYSTLQKADRQTYFTLQKANHQTCSILQ